MRCRGRACCACWGEGRAGCHSGRGRGSGERGCLHAAGAEMDLAKQRVFTPSLAPSPSAFSLRPASRPPSATPPHAARGPYLSSSHWSFGRIARGQARLVAPSGLMQLFLREGHGENEAAQQRHRPASADIHRGAAGLPLHSIACTRVVIRCLSPSTRDGQTLKLSRIGLRYSKTTSSENYVAP